MENEFKLKEKFILDVTKKCFCYEGGEALAQVI